jgi:hypothetical protein
MNQTVQVKTLLKKAAQRLRFPRHSFAKSVFIALFTIACFSFSALSAQGAELQNKIIKLTLGFTPNGLPVIEQGIWKKTGQPVFTDSLASDTLDEWIPEKFIPAELPPIDWQISEDFNFARAEASRDLLNGLRITWIVELTRTNSMFRMKMRLENTGTQPLGIKWFPTWNANWQMGNQAEWLKWWSALSYLPNVKDMKGEGKVTLGSHLHSSDSVFDGETPYWVVGGKDQSTFFALEWCGGWEAKLRAGNGTFAFAVRLPQDDTQLQLTAGETIEGPTLWVTPTLAGTEAFHRRDWMYQRRVMSRRLYHVPPPAFPLNYNNYYATFSKLDGNFLQRQVDAMAAYGFNNLILDFGWSKNVGDWQADTVKFPQNQFEELLATEQEKGANVGLWTCPHLTTKDSTTEDTFVAIDDSNTFNKRVDGYLIDLAGSDFTSLLRNHVTDLRTRYQMNWWKYDQFIFFDDTESGLMKNVVAFQNALRAVRLENPTLAIENCMNGGRMINELTALTSQAIWLRDSSATGLEHAQLNIETTLGAVEFLFPWQAYHFTNNFDQMDANDDELTKYYCRSAMAGTWGISSDLSAIPDRQRKVILREIKYYKQLNALKLNYIYDIEQPAEGKEAAGITFYDWKLQRAGILLYRWQKTGAFTHHLNLNMIQPNKTYKIYDADTKTDTIMSGEDLLNNGLDVAFGASRLSALLFIEPIIEPVDDQMN